MSEQTSVVILSASEYRAEHEELLRLRAEVEELRAELDEARGRHDDHCAMTCNPPLEAR